MTRVYSRDEVREIPIRARRAIGGIVTGEARTRARGMQGPEFADFREYEPGDEVGRIDWNVTARLGKPWVRTYLEERGHPVLLMVDVSSSTDAGRGELEGRDVIVDLAARLGSAAIWRGCETGLLLFADRVIRYVPAGTGAMQLSTMVRELRVRELRRAASDNGLTDVAGALDYAQRAPQRRGMIFLLSDFLCGDFAASLQRCAWRHEIVGIGVRNPEGVPDCGLLNLRDPETGLFRQVDTASAQARAAFDSLMRRRREFSAESFRKAGADFLQVEATRDYAGVVANFLRRRTG